MSLRRRKEPLSDKSRAFIFLCFSVVFLVISVLGIAPTYENIGNALTMVSAIASGIYYTRYMRLRREERE